MGQLCILSTAKPPDGISVPCPALAVSCPQEQKELVTESSSLPVLSWKGAEQVLASWS